MTTLTAPLIDRDLTAPERHTPGSLTSVIGGRSTRITRAGNTRITRAGNTRITRDIYQAYPPLLTAVLINRDLTAPERY